MLDPQKPFGEGGRHACGDLEASRRGDHQVVGRHAAVDQARIVDRLEPGGCVARQRQRDRDRHPLAGRGDCSFASYQQCQATAAGRDAWCAENPYFNAQAEAQNDRSRQHGRRF